MKRWVAVVATLGLAWAMAGASAQALSAGLMAYSRGSVGNDVSWPNCPEARFAHGQWGVVGVNHGKVFTRNLCLAEEASWFPSSTLSLYANTAYPGAALAVPLAQTPRHCASDDGACLAYNYGYNAGVYAVEAAAAQGVHSGWWWLDVEIVNRWSVSAAHNRLALQGEMDGIHHEVVFAQVGFYSTAYQWRLIVGDWHPAAPAWRATGSESPSVAASYCQLPSFTAGPVLLAQYTKTLDVDYVCR